MPGSTKNTPGIATPRPPRQVLLRCLSCGMHATPEMAFYRKFETGKCDCGGGFIVAEVTARCPSA